MTDKELGNSENESIEEQTTETNVESVEKNENTEIVDTENANSESASIENELVENVDILFTSEPIDSEETTIISQVQHNQNPSDHESVIATSSNNSPKLWMGLTLLLAIVLVIVLIKPPFGSNDSNTAVATVNGVDITKETLYNELITLGGTQTLDNLITEELIEQEVIKSKVTISDEDINKELDSVKKNFESEDEFAVALTQAGMTLDNLKDEMKIQVKIRKLVEPQVNVTDEDIKTFFESNADSFGTATLEESSADIKEMLTTQQLSSLSSEWVTELKSNADIKNTLVKEDVSPTETTTEGTTPEDSVTEPAQ